MKVSVNWIKQFIDFELPSVDELVEKIGAQLGAVEEVTDLGAKYQGIPVVKVVVCGPLENSDHLHRCLIDDGGVVKNVERDDKGLVQVLTGAPNIQQDMLAVWLPPGATVPESVGKDPFVLESREMRGAMSHGMLASLKELALGDGHDGLLAIDKDVAPGTPFVEVYKLDDHIIDIENKMFTHRPDCFGALGVAREVAGILGHKFTSPDWYRADASVAAGSGLKLSVENEIPGQVPRFTAIALTDIVIKPSPLWLQVALLKIGQKPINNVVDLTNFYMQVTGQPLHAYDYDKVAGGKLGVRLAKPGEKLELLNGKSVALNEADMVITDGAKAIGLGGVMGGAETEVSNETKNIILECATFDMYTIRRTSMRHGLFTDAVTRFNKGQSPLQNRAVLAKITDDVQKMAGGKPASELVDDNHAADRTSVYPPVKVSTTFINERLGLQLSTKDMATILSNVEFDVEISGDELTVTAPFWRTDIELREDVVEEVGRLYGFDKLPMVLPKRDLTPAVKDPLLELKMNIRSQLVKAGANEVLTYSFVHGDLLDKVDQDKSQAFSLSNALSPDLQYYRLSLIPSLLEKVHPNIKAGYDEFALFELGKSHFFGEMDANEGGVPNEDSHIALIVAYADKQAPPGAAYYYAQPYLAQIVPAFSASLVPLTSFDLSKDAWGKELTAPYEPSRTAVIVKQDQIWGVVGEFKSSVKRALKLPKFVAGFEMHLDLLSNEGQRYVPLPRFPKVSQDITLKVSVGTTYQEVYELAGHTFDEHRPENTISTLSPIDIYQKEGEDTKNVTLRFTIASYERTLTDQEVNALLDHIAEAAKTSLKAERI